MRHVRLAFIALCIVPITIGMIGRMLYISIEVGMELADALMLIIGKDK